MAESELLNLTGVGPKAAKTLEDCGYNTIEKIAKATAEELSKLPGIGLATAEKIVNSAKEFKPVTKIPTAKKPVTKIPTAKKPVTKIPTAKKPVTKIPTAKKPTPKVEEKAIPKPKVPKATPAPTVAAKKTEPRPSVKEPVAKAPVTRKPAVAAKPPTKKPTVKVSPTVSEATKKAIEQATLSVTIKKKRTKKSKPKKLAKVSKTYGIVNSVLHDKTGKSKNKAVVMQLYETEIPIEKYLGRRVKIDLPNSEKQIVGLISKVHGRRSSHDNMVIVRFSKNVSPHIVTARGIVL